MSDNVIQSADNALSRVPPSEAPGAESAQGLNWSDVSALVWNGKDHVSAPSDGNQAGGFAGLAGVSPTEASDNNPGGGAQEAHLPSLQVGDFKAEALHVFDHLDPNHTGSVSKGQIAEAIQHDPSIKGQNAEALAAIYDLKAEEGRIHAPRGVDPNILTRTELEKMPDSLTQESIRQDQLHMIGDPRLQSSFDTNNDGRVSQAGVTSVMGDKIGASYGQMAHQYAAKHLDPAEQARVQQGGLTKDELSGLAKDEDFKVFEADVIYHRLQRAHASLTSTKDTDLYENPTHPLQSIKPDDVKQGLAGDCYFNSVLSSVASKQPEIIRDAITEGQDGSYKVTFKGDPDHPMTVAAPTDTELALYDGASQDGIWPSVMEKAFADHQVLFGHRSLKDDTPQDAATSGNAKNAVELLTGQPSQQMGLAPPAAMQPVDGLVADAGADTGATPESLIAGLKVLAATGNYAFVGTIKSKVAEENGLAPGHNYSVIGYEDGPNGGTFELRNPWGDTNRKNGDYFKISADQLAEALNNVTYSVVSPQTTASPSTSTPFESLPTTIFMPG